MFPVFKLTKASAAKLLPSALNLLILDYKLLSIMTITWGKPPSENISLDDCEWYHTMEIPGIPGGITPSKSFDMRKDIGNILGNLDFKDKKVLNLGQSTGYLSFECERRGADVTSIDLSVDSEDPNS